MNDPTPCIKRPAAMNPARLRLGELLAYSGLAIPLAVLSTTLGTYLPSFYARDLGLSMTVIGAIMFMGRIWDAAVDPVVGLLSDQTRSAMGRRKSWVVFSTPMLMVAVYFCFLPPPSASTLYLAIVTLFIYLAWAMIQIPYLSWGVELSDDYSERSRITGFREAGSMLGVVASVALPLAVFGTEDSPLGDILLLYAAVLLVLLPAGALAAALWCKDDLKPTRRSSGEPISYGQVMRNRPFLRFILIFTAFRMAWSGFDGIYVFLFTSYLKFPGGFLTFVFLQYAVSIAFSPVIVKLAGRFGKHRVLAVSLVGGALVAVALGTIVRPGHLLDAIVTFALFGITNAALWILPTAIVADITDFGKLSDGGDHAGSYMAVLNLAQKFGLAAGVGLAFPLLDLFGYSASGPNDADGLLALRWVAGAMPPLLLIPAALWLWAFPIDERRQAIIRRRLATRPSRQGLAPFPKLA